MEYADFVKKLKELNLSKVEFANIVKMHPMSVSNWKQGKVPSWVEPFLHYYKKCKDLESALNLLKDSNQKAP